MFVAPTRGGDEGKVRAWFGGDEGAETST
jgi:hypothetical protein